VAQTLDELYVDVTARGLAEVLAQLRQLRGELGVSGDAAKRMRDGIAESSARAATAMGSANSAAKQMRDGIGQASTSAAASLGAVRQAAGLLPGALGSIVAAAGPVGVAVAAIGAGLALVSQGFQGTAEMDQFGQAITMVAREMAAFFAPAVQLAADLLKQMVGIFQSTGAAGQLLLGRLSPIGVLFEVLANAGVQNAFEGLLVSVGQLVQAMQPLLNLFANLGTQIIDVFVVGPIIAFTRALTFVVLLLKEVAERAFAVARAFGLLNSPLFNQPAQQRRQVTLQQTGTEDANSTFQRIQQAVLRAGGPATEEEKQTSELEQIKEKVKEIATKFDESIAPLRSIASLVGQLVTNPTAAAQGTVAAAGTGVGVGLGVLGGLFRRP
jgi:hypothetical protein